MTDDQIFELALAKYQAGKVGTVHVAREPQWVSVSDRLPEVGPKVLTVRTYWINNVDEGRFVDIMCLTPEGHWVDAEGESFVHDVVTHWQPLPAPPKPQL